MEKKYDNPEARDNQLRMPATLNVFEDAGHGWIQVPLHVLEALVIQHLISTQSKQFHDQVYLHYGRDANTFYSSFIKYCHRNPSQPLFDINSVDHGAVSPINNMDDYRY